MFECRCATCEIDGVYDDLTGAQAVFETHAARHHEVVLERIDRRSHGRESPADVDPDASDVDARGSANDG